MISKRYSTFALLLVFCILLQSNVVMGTQKWAQTGFQFLSVCSDARGVAMGEAMTSLQLGSSALFFNPAGMAGMKTKFDVTFSQNKWIADMTHTTASMAFKLPEKWNLGVLGVSFQSVDYGDFYGTRVDGSEQGYTDTGIFSPSAFAAGVGYATYLTDFFNIGAQIRYVHQDLGSSVIAEIAENDTTEKMVDNQLNPLAYDFGTQFKTGIKSLVFGMSLRNFSDEIKYVQEGFQLPLAFNLGVSMDLMDIIDEDQNVHSLLMAVDATHYRAHPEQVRVGLDYTLLDMISVRTGYVSNSSISNFSFGMGIKYSGVQLDYAYTPFQLFNNVQRITARIAF